MNYNFKRTSQPVTFGLSLLAGSGLAMIILSLAVGVNVSETTGNLLLFTFLGGIVFMILGIGGWLIYVQPYKHFDDINKPLEDDHGHAAPSTETAIVPHAETAIAVEAAHDTAHP